MYDMNGYEFYFDSLKKSIITNIDEAIDNKLLNIWFDQIELLCKDYFYQYIVGERDGFELTDDELEQTFDAAGILYSSDLLDQMCEDEVIKVSVNESGDLLYSENK